MSVIGSHRYVTRGKMLVQLNKVSIDGMEISPKRSQKLVNHSPDGFNWGYGGSGPAQLALAILLHFTSDEEWSLRNYQTFKSEVIAGLHESGFVIPSELVVDWIADRLSL